MAKHGLTRVAFRGDKVIIVAGAVPQEIIAEAAEITPVPAPGATRHIPKPTSPPARVPKGAKVVDAPIQADPPSAGEETK